MSVVANGLGQVALLRNRNWNDHENCFNLNANYEPTNSKLEIAALLLFSTMQSFYSENPNFGLRATVWQMGQPGLHFLMISYTNLFEKIAGPENLRKAARKARKGKGSRKYVIEFEKQMPENLENLRSELLSGMYRSQPLHRFVIRDPKTRVIHAPAFRDRVMHHAICNIIEPIFDRTFIYDSYASRKGKGTHSALQRFDEFKRKVSRNGKLSPYANSSKIARCRAARYDMIRGWVLKADIRHYFPSIDHEVLIRFIRKKVADERTLSLLKDIIDAYATTLGKGMPLGALTSQLFANVYLNPLDHFVKEKLRCKFYLRYLDDFVLLHSSRQQLEEWKYEIEKFLSAELKLKLHPEKTSIFSLHRGVPLLGFRCFYHYRLLKKSNLRHFLRKIELIEDPEERRKSLEGWMSHAAWGNTYRLRLKVQEQFGKILV